MNRKGKLLTGALAFSTVISLSACSLQSNKNQDIQKLDEASDTYENIAQIQENEYENNGNMFVKYNGEIYFREYTNTSEEESYIWANYMYKANEEKTVKKIKEDGSIEDVFVDQGAGIFYIIDDRFYGSNDGVLYTVNMQGEDYIKIGQGFFIDADEKEHCLYFQDYSNEGRLYAFDTQLLQATEKIDQKYLDYLLIDGQFVYYILNEKDALNEVVIMKYDMKTGQETKLTSLKDTRNSEEISLLYDPCIIDNYIVDGQKLYAIVGTREGTARIFGYGVLYEVDLLTGETQTIASGVDSELALDGNRLYYSLANYEYGSFDGNYHSIDLTTREIHDEDDLDRYWAAKDGVRIGDISRNEISLTFADNTQKFVFTKTDQAAIESKYLSNYSEEERYVDIKDIELVDHKLFYKVQASVLDPEADIGWRVGYRHIASEIHCYDILKNTDIILYSYEI